MTARPLTTAEAADRLGVSARMVRHYVKTERLAYIERIGTTMMFDPAAVDALAPTIIRRGRTSEVAA